ncbi:MAG: DUF4292 domain-containing protein, partial [Sphingobacteriaceae bacterium]
MRKNILNKVLPLCCLVIIMAGCKAKKQLVNRNVPVKVKPASAVAEKLAAIRSKQVNFSTFAGKAKTQLAIDGDNNDCTLNIRIKKDTRIWVSVTALLGIEVARAVITPDSILIINKLQGIYIKKPFSFVHKYAGKQVDYDTLQSLLVGNAIPKLLNDSTAFEPDAPNTNLSGTLDGLLYKLILGPDLRVTQTSLTNGQARQSLQVTNKEFVQEANRVVPSQIDIASVVKNQKIQVNLRYTKVEFDQQLEYPLTLISASSTSPSEWKDFDVVIMPSGQYPFLSDKSGSDALRSWISEGGKIVALEGAVGALAKLDWTIKSKKGADEDTSDTYAALR